MMAICDETYNKTEILISKLTSNRTAKMKDYSAIFLISVGKDNFKNEAVEAAVKMINEEFNECYIVVADTLQRHNIATEKNVSEDIAYKEALKNGDEWITKYSEIFKLHLSIPYYIIRWDSLINNDKFTEKKVAFLDCLKKSELLSAAMEESIAEYGNRLKKRLGEQYFKTIFQEHKMSCFTYLQEECIAISLFPKLLNLNERTVNPLVIVYPGKSTAILTENREVFIKREYPEMFENYNDFLNWLPYRFNKVKNYTQKNNIQFQSGNYKNYFDDLEKIKLINQISEKQLQLMEQILDKKYLEFKKKLLQNLLINAESYLKKQALDIILKTTIETTNYLADLFTEQLLSLFNTLEKNIANKCKANMIRILKK